MAMANWQPGIVEEDIFMQLGSKAKSADEGSSRSRSTSAGSAEFLGSVVESEAGDEMMLQVPNNFMAAPGQDGWATLIVPERGGAFWVQ